MFFRSRPFVIPLKIIPLAQCLLAGSLMLLEFSPVGISATVTEREPLQVLIVTGGHDFERKPFFAMFEAMPGIQWKEAIQPGANDLWTE